MTVFCIENSTFLPRQKQLAIVRKEQRFTMSDQ